MSGSIATHAEILEQCVRIGAEHALVAQTMNSLDEIFENLDDVPELLRAGVDESLHFTAENERTNGSPEVARLFDNVRNLARARRELDAPVTVAGVPDSPGRRPGWIGGTIGTAGEDSRRYRGQRTKVRGYGDSDGPYELRLNRPSGSPPASLSFPRASLGFQGITCRTRRWPVGGDVIARGGGSRNLLAHCSVL
jgi:hypothetical protein